MALVISLQSFFPGLVIYDWQEMTFDRAILSKGYSRFAGKELINRAYWNAKPMSWNGHCDSAFIQEATAMQARRRLAGEMNSAIVSSN
jgi:hypothetical protein